MIVGIPKEIKRHEYRVGVTPTGVVELVREGQVVLVEAGAGEGSGFDDVVFARAGARMTDRRELFQRSELIVKVKEPLPEEYDPVYQEEGILHYTVANMPGAYPRTATLALTNATLPYVLLLTRRGIAEALATDPVVGTGLNTWRGGVAHRGLAEATGTSFRPFQPHHGGRPA